MLILAGWSMYAWPYNFVDNMRDKVDKYKSKYATYERILDELDQDIKRGIFFFIDTETIIENYKNLEMESKKLSAELKSCRDQLNQQ